MVPRSFGRVAPFGPVLPPFPIEDTEQDTRREEKEKEDAEAHLF